MRSCHGGPAWELRRIVTAKLGGHDKNLILILGQARLWVCHFRVGFECFQGDAAPFSILPRHPSPALTREGGMPTTPLPPLPRVARANRWRGTTHSPSKDARLSTGYGWWRGAPLDGLGVAPILFSRAVFPRERPKRAGRLRPDSRTRRAPRPPSTAAASSRSWRPTAPGSDPALRSNYACLPFLARTCRLNTILYKSLGRPLRRLGRWDAWKDALLRRTGGENRSLFLRQRSGSTDWGRSGLRPRNGVSRRLSGSCLQARSPPVADLPCEKDGLSFARTGGSPPATRSRKGHLCDAVH